jgi:hypothetical protein
MCRYCWQATASCTGGARCAGQWLVADVEVLCLTGMNLLQVCWPAECALLVIWVEPRNFAYACKVLSRACAQHKTAWWLLPDEVHVQCNARLTFSLGVG